MCGDETALKSLKLYLLLLNFEPIYKDVHFKKRSNFRSTYLLKSRCANIHNRLNSLLANQVGTYYLCKQNLFLKTLQDKKLFFVNYIFKKFFELPEMSSKHWH